MARTRTNPTVSNPTQRAPTAQQEPRTGGLRRIQQRGTRSNSKVQFSNVVQVQNLEADEETEGSNAARNVREPRGAGSSRKKPIFKVIPQSNIHVMAHLPSPPPSAASPSRSSTGSVHGDLPGTANANVGPSTVRRPTPQPLSGPQPTSMERRSSLLASPSPRTAEFRKRVRADESTFYQPSKKRARFEYDAETDLAFNLYQSPRALAPEEVSALFSVLREELHDFAFQNFRFEHTAEAQMDWPLHELDDTYYSLMLTAQFIADGSQYGWHHFFTTPDSRASLVYGVIAEYIRRHVFSAPAFGFSTEDTRAVENIDHLYMHYDNHVRARHRATAVRSVLDVSNWRTTSGEAIQQLAEDLLQLLTPLLPPEIFAHDESSAAFTVRNDRPATKKRNNLLRTLVSRIQMAVNLHYSIRLTGADGSIVQFCNTLTKGSKWFGDYGAPQNCVNPEMMQKTQFHGWMSDDAIRRPNALDFTSEGVAGGPDDDGAPRRPLVKMVCFPRIEMTVPKGPDVEQLAEIEAEYKRSAHYQARLAASSDSEESDDSDSEDDGDNAPADDAKDINWDDVQAWVAAGNARTPYLKGRDGVWERAPAMVRHYHEIKNGKWPIENGELRLPYEVCYQHIGVNDVYLEHDYVEPTEKEFVERSLRERSEPSVSPLRNSKPTNLDADADTEDESSSNGSSSPTSGQYTGEEETVRATYEDHLHDIRTSYLPTMNRVTRWRHGLPIPASERLSLQAAVREARAQRSASSRMARLRFAATDASRNAWNALARHSMLIDYSLTGLVALAAVVWCTNGRSVAGVREMVEKLVAKGGDGVKWLYMGVEEWSAALGMEEWQAALGTEESARRVTKQAATVKAVTAVTAKVVTVTGVVAPVSVETPGEGSGFWEDL